MKLRYVFRPSLPCSLMAVSHPPEQSLLDSGRTLAAWCEMLKLDHDLIMKQALKPHDAFWPYSNSMPQWWVVPHSLRNAGLGV